MSSKFPVSGVKARTIPTFDGKCCRKSSRRKAPSVFCALSPSSCCMQRRSCDSFLSPSSSALNNCCNHFCSYAAVCFINCSFILLYSVLLGGYFSSILLSMFLTSKLYHPPFQHSLQTYKNFKKH